MREVQILLSKSISSFPDLWYKVQKIIDQVIGKIVGC